MLESTLVTEIIELILDAVGVYSVAISLHLLSPLLLALPTPRSADGVRDRAVGTLARFFFFCSLCQAVIVSMLPLRFLDTIFLNCRGRQLWHRFAFFLPWYPSFASCVMTLVVLDPQTPNRYLSKAVAQKFPESVARYRIRPDTTAIA